MGARCFFLSSHQTYLTVFKVATTLNIIDTRPGHAMKPNLAKPAAATRGNLEPETLNPNPLNLNP